MACVSLKRPLDLDPLEVLHSPNRPPTKRQRCTPLKGLDRDSTDGAAMASASASAFRESGRSPAEIANHLREILKPARRRRQIFGDDDDAAVASTSTQLRQSHQHHEAAMIEMSVDSHHQQQQPAEKPVFTLKQMTIICEKICKERTDRVREEYDLILQQKLSEQYDSFVKFIDHQIQQRFNSQSQLPSYLS